MTWTDLTPAIQDIAKAALTPKQLEAWKLEVNGYGLRLIAQELDVSRGSIADRIEAAHRTLRHAGVRQDASGNWYLTLPRSVLASPGR